MTVKYDIILYPKSEFNKYLLNLESNRFKSHFD